MAVKTYMISGEARWAKILGEAPPGYDNGPAEWTIDLVLGEEAKKAYLASGGDPFYIKETKDTGEDYLKFVRKAVKKDGDKSQNIRVVGPDGKDWDQTKLIGNGSIVNVRYSLNIAEHKKVKRMKPSILAVQVWEHKPFVGKSEFPTRQITPEEAASENKDW